MCEQNPFEERVQLSRNILIFGPLANRKHKMAPLQKIKIKINQFKTFVFNPLYA